ncbi:MAG: hypothetical protein KGL39_20725 [Patescibacteria group bacterium]|nr:hypothetical protein [Patescibacteria group bacterium]
MASITIERVDQPPLTVSTGDAVRVWLQQDEFAEVIVLGISHARGMVRVAPVNAVRPGGSWMPVGCVYPSQTTPAHSPVKSAGLLSAALTRSNARYAPATGWSAADKVKK